MVQEGEKHEAPLTISREILQKYSGLMGQLDSTEPPSCKEATSQQVWVDAMIEEYSSIMKNDVWEVVLRPTRKSVMTIAPIDRYTTFGTIISLVALFGWKLHKIDVKTVLLNGKVEVENYVEQPKGFVKKALYVPRSWYARMDGFLHGWGFPKVRPSITCTLRLS